MTAAANRSAAACWASVTEKGLAQPSNGLLRLGEELGAEPGEVVPRA